MATENEIRNWNMFCHLAALAGFTGIPAANVIGPLIIWLMKKNELPSVDEHGKDSINFQISVLIYIIVSWILCFIFIGFILLPIVGIGALICVIIASIKASNGERFQYPATIRFIK